MPPVLSTIQKQTAEWDWAALFAGDEIQPKPFQIRTTNAILKGSDVILIAPTSTGKGAIFVMIIHAEPKKIWFVILPLKALELEMVKRLGKTATYVNEDHRGDKLLKRIRKGKYNMIFLSVEMAATVKIRDIIMDPKFSRCLGGLIVDEAHIIKDWGTDDFRQEYKNLGHLKNLLNVNVVAMSATLTPGHIDVVKDVLEMDDPVMINQGSDRPNLELRVIPMRHSAGLFMDLLYALTELRPYIFPLPSSQPLPTPSELLQSFPTTYIYHSSKTVNKLMSVTIKRWFGEAGVVKNVVGLYDADFSEGHKQEVVEKVRNRTLLVVICTDALGMGSDVKQVTRVIQWRLDSTTTLTSWWQRIGRAARDYSTTGIGYLLVERSLVEKGVLNFVKRTGRLPANEEEITEEDWTGKKGGDGADVGPATKGVADKGRTQPKRVADPQMVIMTQEVFLNSKCIRKIALQHLEQPEKSTIDPPSLLYSSSKPYDAERDRALPCCSSCSRTPLEPVLREEEQAAVKRKARKGILDRRMELEEMLFEWRDEMWLRDWAALGIDAFMGKDYFLSSGVIADLSAALGQIEYNLNEEHFKLSDYIAEDLFEDVAQGLMDLLHDAIDIQEKEEPVTKKRATDKVDKRLEKLQAACELAYERQLLGLGQMRTCGACREWNQANNDPLRYPDTHTGKNSDCPYKPENEGKADPFKRISMNRSQVEARVAASLQPCIQKSKG